MIYTKWIEVNYPALTDVSSADKYALIKDAKKSSLVWTLGARSALILIAIVLVQFLSSLFGIVPFQGLVSWLLYVAAILVATVLGFKIEQAIVFRKISKLISARQHRSN